MPTIKLTISAELLDALVAGEAVDLQATLRQVRKKASLPPEQAAHHKAVSDLVAHHRPDWSIPHAWNTVKRLPYPPEEVQHALSVCLDWCEGLVYKPLWFANDYVAWAERGAETDLLALEEQRTRWRQGKVRL